MGVAALVLAAGLSLTAPSQSDARARLTLCNNNLDDDSDGKIDNTDPGCQNARDDNEANPANAAPCADQQDNDNDGKIDFPADPGCSFAGNNNEAPDPTPVPQCADGQDNDSDGTADFAGTATLPADPDCAWAADAMENTRACSDNRDNDGDGKIDFPLDFGCAGPNNGNESDPPQCNDGRDNDIDGTLDIDTNIPGQTADPNCASATDDSEALGPGPPGPPPPAARCADGKDNDGDGKIDFPDDPGCASAADDDETDAPPGLPPVVASCADGRDNDGDGRTDFPADPGCASAADDDEGPLVAVVPSSGEPRALTPFPVVRLRGRASRRSVRITLLTVTAPAGSKVSVYCVGPRCPSRRLAILAGRKIVRVRRFERRLRAGTVLRIYVTKPGFVGKYTRFRIRSGRAPQRVDRCALRPAAAAVRCPAS